MTALERSEALAGALTERAAARGLDLAVIRADARELAAERAFALVLAPMQFAHLLGGAAGRRAVLDRCATALQPGGALALALLADVVPLPASGPPPLPDVREVDGWIHSSLAVEVRDIGDGVELRRLRQLVSPTGALTESLDVIRLDRLAASGLESEARGAGFDIRDRIEIPPTDDHVGSTVVVVEVPR